MNNLKNEAGAAVISLMAVLLIGVCIFAGIQYRKANQSHQEQKQNPATFEQPNTKIKEFTSKDSIKHYIYAARETSRSSFKDQTVISPTYVDSLAEALKISNHSFNEVAQINATLEGKMKAMRVSMDSLNRRTYYFQQKYLTAQFRESDSTLTYKYNSQIGYASYNQKSGFLGLGKTKKQIDIYSKDPDMTINGVKQLTIKDNVRRKPFGIGIQAGYFWNASTGTVDKGIGFGLSYSLIRF